MPKIRVNCSILGKRPGNIVTEGDKHYETFKSWAERKDRRNGTVICEFCEPEPQGKAGTTTTDDAKETGTESAGGKEASGEGEDAPLDALGAGLSEEGQMLGGNKDIPYTGPVDKLKQARGARGQKN